MKWDNTSGLSPEAEKQLNNHIQKWLDEKPNPDDGVDSQDTRTLIIDLYAIYKGANSSLEKARLQSEIIQKGAQWDTDNPALAQKYIPLGLSAKFAGSSAFKAIIEKDLQWLGDAVKAANLQLS